MPKASIFIQRYLPVAIKFVQPRASHPPAPAARLVTTVRPYCHRHNPEVRRRNGIFTIQVRGQMKIRLTVQFRYTIYQQLWFILETSHGYGKDEL